MPGVSIIIAVLLVALWKRREINALAKTFRVKEAILDAAPACGAVALALGRLRRLAVGQTPFAKAIALPIIGLHSPRCCLHHCPCFHVLSSMA